MRIGLGDRSDALRGARRSIWVNAALLTIVALAASQLVHELAHAGAGLVVGAETVLVSLFAAYIEPAGLSEGALVAVAVAAPAVNVLVGVAAWGASRAVAGRAPWWSVTLLLIAAFSLLMGFGYAMVDPVFYQPGAPGDFAVLLDAVNGSVAWRIGLFAVGSAGWVATMFALATELWRFQHPAVRRTGLGMALLLLPYLLAVALMVPAAGWLHPLGSDGAIIIALQYVFGMSALVWSFFLSTRWLSYRSAPQPIVLPAGLDLGVGVAAILGLGMMAITRTPIALRV